MTDNLVPPLGPHEIPPAPDPAEVWVRHVLAGPEEGRLVDVTPARAAALTRRAAARYVAARLDGKRVAKYATFMLLGTWQPSPEPVPVTGDGYLINGLNRLMAIILSGTTQQMIIATEPRPVAELGMAFHSGPRVCDVQPLPEDHPARSNA